MSMLGIIARIIYFVDLLEIIPLRIAEKREFMRLSFDKILIIGYIS